MHDIGEETCHLLVLSSLRLRDGRAAFVTEFRVDPQFRGAGRASHHRVRVRRYEHQHGEDCRARGPRPLPILEPSRTLTGYSACLPGERYAIVHEAHVAAEFRQVVLSLVVAADGGRVLAVSLGGGRWPAVSPTPMTSHLQVVIRARRVRPHRKLRRPIRRIDQRGRTTTRPVPQPRTPLAAVTRQHANPTPEIPLALLTAARQPTPPPNRRPARARQPLRRRFLLASRPSVRSSRQRQHPYPLRTPATRRSRVCGPVHTDPA